MLRLWQNNKIEILAEREDRVIRGVSVTIKMPAIIMLKGFIGFKSNKDGVTYSPQAVYERDKNMCQYLHRDEYGKPFQYKCKAEERSIDHVIPKDMGGPNSFENCVTACRICNVVIKRNRTPEQAGLVLVRRPFVPEYQKRGFVVQMEFKFNPDNAAHRIYAEKILKIA